jgi:AraC-like DNA-binding protein
MDPLSDVLALLGARSVLSASLAAGGAWCLQFPAHDCLRFGTLAEGACWLAGEGLGEPVRLQAGDCYLMTDGRPYKIGSDLDVDVAQMRSIEARIAGRVIHYGDDQDPDRVLLIGGRFLLDAANADFLLDTLPPLIHIRAGSEQAAVLGWVLERLVAEQMTNGAGATAMLSHLADIVLLQTLRACLAADEGEMTGWLAALSDARIGKALGLLHEQPARRWTLVELAAAVGMSRSAFAARFKALVGNSPLDYLLRWRMRLAGQMLREGSTAVSGVARALGYDSESAFSNAFKRVMGMPPRRFREGGT